MSKDPEVAVVTRSIVINSRSPAQNSMTLRNVVAHAGSGQAQVGTWWGMAVLAVFAGILTVFSVVLLLAPLGQGQGPMWGALFLTALGGGLSIFTVRLSIAEYRAKQLRKLRGSPEPTPSGRADI